MPFLKFNIPAQGLGTSTSKEGKEYFSALRKHKKDFIWGSENDGDAIEMAFSKKKVDDRKTWLRHYKVRICIDSFCENSSSEGFRDLCVKDSQS